MEASPARQVADKVSSFSSQYGGDGSKSYTAGNLAGNSYNFPSYGDFTQAFVLVSSTLVAAGCLAESLRASTSVGFKLSGLTIN